MLTAESRSSATTAQTRVGSASATKTRQQQHVALDQQHAQAEQGDGDQGTADPEQDGRSAVLEEGRDDPGDASGQAGELSGAAQRRQVMAASMCRPMTAPESASPARPSATRGQAESSA